MPTGLIEDAVEDSILNEVLVIKVVEFGLSRGQKGIDFVYELSTCDLTIRVHHANNHRLAGIGIKQNKTAHGYTDTDTGIVADVGP
ncbi:hypothetical protein ES703_43268 [subsurface metagenome]